MKASERNIALSDFSKKVLDGVRTAVNRLVEKAAAKGEDLVIGDANGNPKRVPAKELLKKIQQS